jgi:hypothetical protein
MAKDRVLAVNFSFTSMLYACDSAKWSQFLGGYDLLFDRMYDVSIDF